MRPKPPPPNPWLLAVAAAYTAVCLLQVRCTSPRPVVNEPQVVRPEREEALTDTRPPQTPSQAEKLIPAKPEDWQKRPPCDESQDERVINGACWQATSRRPPCGTLYRSGDLCVRPIAKAKPQPVSGQE